MFRDVNHHPVDFASLPPLHIKRRFKRQTPTIEDLNKLVRVVRPLSDRFAARLQDSGHYEGPAYGNKEQLLSRPSLCVRLVVANDEVCRVRVTEDWTRESDVWHNEKFSQTVVVDRRVVEDCFGKLRSVMIGSKARCGSDSTNVFGLEELTSVETPSDMSLCSDDDFADTRIMFAAQKGSSWQASICSLLESEDMENLEKKRPEKNTINSFRNETLKEVLVDQLSSEAERGALMTTSRAKQHLKDLSTYHQNVSWQFPAVSDTMVQNFGSINITSNSDSDGRAPNPGHSIQSSWASAVKGQGMDSMGQIVGDYYKRNSNKNDQFSELTERNNQNDSFNKLVELKGRLKTKHGKDECIFRTKHRSDQKQEVEVEVEDEDILNEGWMELEKAFKRRAEHHTDEKKHKKLENVHLFHGRTILVGKGARPMSIPMEDVSNEIHYKWKDGQLVSYMKDPRLEKYIGQKKENPAQCDLIQVSFAKSTDTNIFIKSEPCMDAYEIVETLSKAPSSTSCLQSYSEKARSHGTNSFTYKSKDATDKPISNVPHNIQSVHDQVTANEYLPVCADGKTLKTVECAYPIPSILSQSYISYVENSALGGPDDVELDQNILPPDWIDEHSPETQQGRPSCGYVNEVLRNIYKCILDAKVTSNEKYRDAVLTESLQCIKLALNIHSKL